MSVYLRNLCADEITNRTISLRLHSGDPGSNGTANRIGSVEQSVAAAGWGAAANGVSKVTAATSFGVLNSGGSETVTHVSAWDGTNFLDSVQLASSVTVAAGATFTLAANTLGFSVEEN